MPRFLLRRVSNSFARVSALRQGLPTCSAATRNGAGPLAVAQRRLGASSCRSAASVASAGRRRGGRQQDPAAEGRQFALESNIGVFPASAASSGSGGTPRGRYFTRSHEWFQVEEDGVGIVGITQVAQQALGEIVFCRLPREGERYGVMDTLVTLEALKTVGEVHSPVAGTVLEVNPRLEREPGLVTHAPLGEGWLVRLAFKRVPDYLQRTRTVSRDEVEQVLMDAAALQDFVAARLGEARAKAPENAGLPQELIFDGLRSSERAWVHQAAQALGFQTESHGRGPGRQLMVGRDIRKAGRSKASGGEADVEAVGAE